MLRNAKNIHGYFFLNQNFFFLISIALIVKPKYFWHFSTKEKVMRIYYTFFSAYIQTFIFIDQKKKTRKKKAFNGQSSYWDWQPSYCGHPLENNDDVMNISNRLAISWSHPISVLYKIWFCVALRPTTT